MPRKALLMATLLMGSVATYACSIEEYIDDGGCGPDSWSDDSSCYSDPPDNNKPPSLCEEYCAKLVSCGAIEVADFDSCETVCGSAYGFDSQATKEGCACTVEQSCEEVMNDPCDGAPVPPDPCAVDGCPDDPQPCDASCECAEGEQCIDGACTPSAPPPESCNADCECPSGQQCLNNVCVDPP